MTAGVYLHIPFCKSRCSYCDFATDIYRSSEAVDRYVAALCTELGMFGHADRNATGSDRAVMPAEGPPDNTRGPARNTESRVAIDTIYFGGGTPSLLTSKQVEKILDAIYQAFDVDTGAEITMEMNPGTVNPDSLRGYRSLGVDRASFGVQTFNDRHLRLLARGHDANDARQTYRMLRDAGFDNISFDLIAGLPGQTRLDWVRNLDEAIKMAPEHLSLYLLEIHEATPLAEQVRSGRRPRPDDDLAARMYETMCEKLAEAGYQQYEISNFARPGSESRHNSKYWRMEPVFGFGVSAHSFDGCKRYANTRDTAEYVESIESCRSAGTFCENIDIESEHIFLGLRLNQGIDLDQFRTRFGNDLSDRFRGEIGELTRLELLEVTPTTIRLTGKGRLYSNEVFQRFIS